MLLTLGSTRARGRLSHWHVMGDCSAVTKGRKVRPLSFKKLQVLAEEDGTFVCYRKGKRVGTLCVWCLNRLSAG